MPLNNALRFAARYPAEHVCPPNAMKFTEIPELLS
jgi:hypothetical protein